MMTRRSAAFLRAFAGWTVFVWLVFVRNILRDRQHSAGFKVVHVVLAVVSVAFALGTLAVVARARRSSDVPAGR
jgi:hypothetical protein